MTHLFKLKKDGKTVGYLEFKDGKFIYSNEDGSYISPYCISIWKDRVFSFSPPFHGSYYEHDECEYDSIHPYVCTDKNGKDVFRNDEVLVYRGKENIGEGYVDFNERFLWWTVNNSNQDCDRESPQDWSQLTLCDVDIELIEEVE